MTSDVKGSMFMTYDKITKFRVGRAHKCNDVSTERRGRQGRSRIGDNESFWGLQKTSISIYSRRLENKTESANPRAEDSIYCKASRKPGLFNKVICRYNWQIIKQYSYSSANIIFEEKAAWPRNIVKGKFKCFTHMIALAIIRFHKFIDCWFLRNFGNAAEAIQP